MKRIEDQLAQNRKLKKERKAKRAEAAKEAKRAKDFRILRDRMTKAQRQSDLISSLPQSCGGEQ